MASTSLEYIAATAEEAINKGLMSLNVTRDDVDIEVLDNGKKGIFGIGARQARIRMTIKPDSLRASIQKEEAEAQAAPAEEPKPVETPAPSMEKPAAPAQSKAEKPARSEKPARAEKPARSEKPARPEKSAAAKKENNTEQGSAKKHEAVQAPDKPKAESPVKVEVNIEKPADLEEGEGDPVVNEETMQITSNVVRDLLEKMHVKASIQAKIGEAADEVDSRVILIDIQGDDLSFLIGRHSEVLHSLQYITSLIVGREVGHWVPLVIDVQGFRERRERQLRQMAGRMAEQVIKTGRRISLEPMSATERRIIHLALRDNNQITTESIGEEPNRKVVIYPKDKK